MTDQDLHPERMDDEPAGVGQPPETGEQLELLYASHYQGPLPPPAMLNQYNSVASGAADRIIAMAERQQVHRMECESKALDAQIRSEARGTWLGALVALAFLVAATGLTLAGYQVAGIILGGIDLVALVGVFVYGRWHQSRELRLKRQAIEDAQPD